MQRPAVNRVPLSKDETALIDRAKLKFRNQLLQRYSKRKRKLKEEQLRNIEYDTNAFATDLKDLMINPTYFNVTEIGEILAELSPAERLLLVKSRPHIITDCYDLITLLRCYIPSDSRTLFACAFVELMHRKDNECMKQNIEIVKNLLPQDDQEAYVKFCMKVMREMDAPVIQKEAARSVKYLTSALILTTLSHYAAASLTPVAKKISAAGAILFILKGAYQLNKKLTFWQGVSENQSDSEPPSPSPKL